MAPNTSPSAAAAKPMFRSSKSGASSSPLADKRPLERADYDDCPLTTRLPKALKTGDWAEDAKRDASRSDFCELLNILWNEQQHIHSCLGFVKQLRTREAMGDDLFATPPASFGKLDKEFVAAWIHSTHEKFTKDWIDDRNIDDPEFLHQLLSAMLNLPLTLTVPKPLQESKCLMRSFLRWRLDQSGRLNRVVGAVKATSFDKLAGGPFSLTWKEDVCFSISHVSGATVEVPSHIRILKTFPLMNWWSDQTAYVDLSPHQLFLKGFFKRSEGPNLNLLTKQVVAEKAAELRDASRASHDAKVVAEGSDAQGMLSKSKEEATRRLSAQAKATLANYREKTKRRQQIIL